MSSKQKEAGRPNSTDNLHYLTHEENPSSNGLSPNTSQRSTEQKQQLIREVGLVCHKNALKTSVKVKSKLNMDVGVINV